MNPHHRQYHIWAVLWTIVTLTLSVIPNEDLPKTFFDDLLGIDKIGHAVFYGILFWVWALLMREKMSMYKSMICSGIFSISFGLMMEICQKLFAPDRHFDLLDALANTIGVFFGVILFVRYEKLFPIFAKSN